MSDHQKFGKDKWRRMSQSPQQVEKKFIRVQVMVRTWHLSDKRKFVKVPMTDKWRRMSQAPPPLEKKFVRVQVEKKFVRVQVMVRTR